MQKAIKTRGYDKMWVSFNGRTSAFQADNVSSILITHSKLNYIGFNFDAETYGATVDSSMTLTRLIE